MDWKRHQPDRWSITRLKRVVQPDRPITYGIVQAGENVADGVPYVRPIDMHDEQGVRSYDALLRTSRAIAASYQRSSLRSGDLVCSIGPSFGKVMLVDDELEGGNLTQGTARVAIKDEYVPRFYFWVLRSSSSYAQWEAAVGGATFRSLNLGPLADTVVPLPPRAEQHAIAAFLDHETSRIDALVHEQRRLVELLQQKRIVAMSQAVTSGIREHVPKKASGAKWLAPVPVHWDVVPLKSLAAVDNSGSYGADPEELRVVRPVATTAQIDAHGRFRVDDMPLRSFTRQELRRYECKPGEILVVKSSGSAENIISGKAGLVQDGTPQFVFSNFLMRLRPRTDRTVPEYLYFLLTSHLTRERVKEMCSTTTYPNLNVGSYLAAKVPCPPLSEQRAIADHVARAISTVDATIAEIEASLRLLAERRYALITAAITGQVDTANWRQAASAGAVI